MGDITMLITGSIIGVTFGWYSLPLIRSFDVGDSQFLRWVVLVSTSSLLAISGFLLGTSWDVVPVWTLLAVLVTVTAIDFSEYIVPDIVVFSTFGVLLSVMAPVSLLRGEHSMLFVALFGAGIYLLFMCLVFVLSKGTLGLGDVKLAIPIGLLFGWLMGEYGYYDTFKVVTITFILTSIFGLLFGAAVSLLRRCELNVLPDPLAHTDNFGRSMFPFAPAMTTAAVAHIFWLLIV